jgi:UDPglucose 6-dehydrogenase
MHYVHDAARAIAEVIEDFTVVVVKSTVPIGASDEVERIIAERVPRDRFAVVSNPEFLREGAAIEDFKQPDRVVIGVENARAKDVMREVYRPIKRAGRPILYTSRRSAEMIKYAANVFLAMKVTFINEIANLCERVDADVLDISRGIGLDDRIGPKFLSPGPGFGGSCFPKDIWRLPNLQPRPNRRCDSSRHWLMLTTSARSTWWRRSSPLAAAPSPASGSPCSA